MLILSRRSGQGVVLPELDVAVQVVQAGKNVRLGVDAPDNVTVLRDELYATSRSCERSDRQTRPAAATTPSPGRRLSDGSGPIAGAESPAARLMHIIRNHVNKISLSIQLAERSRSTGDLDAVARSHHRVQSHLDELAALCTPLAEQTLEQKFGAHPVESVPPQETTRKRLLVVEDDADERQMFAEILEQEGFAVETASDGREALQTLHQMAKGQNARRGGAFDALLVDMQMPVCNGAEMIHQARSEGVIRDVPVLVVSGRCPADYGLSLGADGANCWLPKPISPRLLLDRLDQCLTLVG